MMQLHNLTADQVVIIDELIDKLKIQYNILEVFYLSNFFKPDGDKWLFDSLKSVYQSRYQHTDKIVIIQDHADIPEFHGYPGKAISRLQQLLSLIDISNSFVMIVSGNQHLDANLEQVRTLYSTDKFNISHMYEKELEYDQHAACQRRFRHLHAMPLHAGFLP